MPETPKTLVLLPGEWRALTLYSLHALLTSLDQVTSLDDRNATFAKAALDRSSALVEAWRRSSHLPAPQPKPEPQPAAPNGPVKVGITKGNKVRRVRRSDIQPN